MTPAGVTVIVATLALTFPTWRITRFILLDSLIEAPRVKGEKWLAEHQGNRFFRYVAKLYECPFCVSVWVAVGVSLAWCYATDTWLGRLFPFVWLGTAGAAMVPYRYIDPPLPCLPSKMCDEE